MELYDYHWILHRCCRLYLPHRHHRHHFVLVFQWDYMIITGFYIVVVAFIGPIPIIAIIASLFFNGII